MKIEHNGRVYPRPEPQLWDVRLGIVIFAMLCLAIGLLVRESRAFGLAAGLETQLLGGLAPHIEANSIALGISISVMVALFFWDGATYYCWEFAGIVIGTIIEGFCSALSATMHTGQVAYLFSREFTLSVLSIGVVAVWLALGKIFSNAYHSYRVEHAGWYRGGMEWFNKEVGKAERKAEGNAGKQAAAASKGNGNIKTVSVVPLEPERIAALREAFPDNVPFRTKAIAVVLGLGTRQARNVLGALMHEGLVAEAGRYEYQFIAGNGQELPIETENSSENPQANE